MKIIQYLRGTLVDGKHVDEGAIHTVGEDIDAETAVFLVRQGCAEDISDELADGGDDNGNGLAGLKLDELKALAVAEGVDLGDAKTKAAIVEAIENARLTKPGA